MCGIVGFYQPSPLQPQLLDAATDALSHRGPDGRGIWLSPENNIGLGHRRLSIVDPQGGQQPLLNAAGTLVACVNGEFYGYEALREDLEAKGHSFLTHSDSELVLHLYAEYGLEFVHYLRGEFALILYDKAQKKMIALRDRFGIKPLCYAFKDQRLFIASEAKALFAFGIPAAWNEYALYHAFSFQYTPLDQSLFRDVLQVPPGNMLIYDGTHCKVQPYWDVDYSSIKEGPLTDFTQGLEKELLEAIQIRLPLEESHVCCHLSGGIDSASIVAISSKLLGKPLPCFSVSFPGTKYDEMSIAKDFAKSLGAPFYPILVTQEDAIQVLSDAVYYSEGLAINTHLSAKFILNQKIKQAGFKIALSGEGSDELFSGYAHFLKDYNPKMQFFDPVAVGVHISNDPFLPMQSMQKTLGSIPHFMRAKAAIGYRLHQLMGDTSHTPSLVFENILTALPKSQLNLSPIYHSMYFWIKFALSGYILKTLGDGCEMAHGIEGRVPFLDHHLFSYAKDIPLEHKIKNNQEKYILRQVVKPYVGKAMAARRKHPFIAPPLSLFQDAKAFAFIQDSLASIRLPFLNRQKVIKYLNQVSKKSGTEQTLEEPAILLMLTAALLAQRYGL